MRRLGILFAAAALAATALPAWALPARTCARPVEVPGQGPSCRVAGGWEVLLADGTTVTTHGPDPAPADPVSLPGAEAAPPVAPECVADPGTQRHGLVIYAYPADRASNYERLAPHIRLAVERVNGLLRQTAALYGAAADYRMACGAGEVRIDEVQLPTLEFDSRFSTITGDLRALGYASALAKYWVYFDGIVWCGGCAGQGTVHADDRPTADNASNTGGDFGITYGMNSGDFPPYAFWIMMHENGHNLGAVQLGAPHSSGGFHCNDGTDVMCYADGGSRSDYTGIVCPAVRIFDCGGDDYFNPAPAPGSWLATHWNLASPASLFIHTRPLPG